MKKLGGIFCIVVLLLAGITISPALISTKAGDTNNITIYFWDCTGKKPIRTEIEFTVSEWNDLKEQLQNIRTSSNSIEDSFNAQFTLLKQKGLISYEMSFETLKTKALEEFKNKRYRQPRESLLNNTIINAICAINFELSNGTTFVFGLNTFINLVGFDIISFHKGYAVDGIQTKGLLQQSAAPGTYLGSMFGLLGYWFGTKTGTGFYSDLVVSGFTVATTWIHIAS